MTEEDQEVLKETEEGGQDQAAAEDHPEVEAETERETTEVEITIREEGGLQILDPQVQKDLQEKTEMAEKITTEPDQKAVTPLIRIKTEGKQITKVTIEKERLVDPVQGQHQKREATELVPQVSKLDNVIAIVWNLY